jgi:hypothetical protein
LSAVSLSLSCSIRFAVFKFIIVSSVGVRVSELIWRIIFSLCRPVHTDSRDSLDGKKASYGMKGSTYFLLSIALRQVLEPIQHSIERVWCRDFPGSKIYIATPFLTLTAQYVLMPQCLIS